MISVPDFEAACDILDDTIGEAEGLALEHALDLHRAIEVMKSKCSDALWAIEQGLLDKIEDGTVVRNGFQYETKPNGKWAWDHELVAAVIADEAVRRRTDEETGELPDARDAAMEAAQMMREAYTTPSVQARKGALAEFGIEPKGLRDFKNAKGRKVVKIPIAKEDS